MKTAALALALVPSLALAQWRADLAGPAPDAVVLMVVIGLGLAWFSIKAAYARSEAEGAAMVTIMVLVTCLCAAFPAARALLAIVAACFLVYGVART